MFRKISFAVITAIALGAAAMSPAAAGGKGGHGHGTVMATADTMAMAVMAATEGTTVTGITIIAFTAARPSTSAAIATSTSRPGAACVS